MKKGRKSAGRKRGPLPVGLSDTQRIALAKAKMNRVMDHFLYLLELHANNKFVVYSSLLSQQIPVSYAANAFNIFQKGMHQIEIVRLYALWDSADLQKENIPTVIELIDTDAIIGKLAVEISDHWKKQPMWVLSSASTRERVSAAILREVKAAEFQFGEEQAAKAKVDLKRAIADARAILSSPRLAAIANLRDKHLAHSLAETRRERGGPVPTMKYGDETTLLEDTIPIVEHLYCWVNGTSFSVSDSQEIDDQNAEALWTACKFTIETLKT